MEPYSLIGIDFATSTTVVKVKNYYDGMSYRDYETLTFDHNAVLPTLVFEDDRGNLYFGYDAESRAVTGTPGRLYKNFKMDLLKEGKEKEKAVFLITEYFRYVHKQFENARSELQYFPNQKVVLSFPAKWTPDLKTIMKKCVVDAGLCDSSNVFEESEPVAAIYAALVWHLEDLQRSKIILKGKSINVFMLDMGAGTSDVAIFKLKIDENNKPVVNQMITYPTMEQDLLCGGREIDDSLNQFMLKYMEKCFPNGIDKDMVPVITDSLAVKTWKDKIVSPTLFDDETVDSAPGYIVKLKTFMRKFGGIKEIPFDTIDRGVFETLTRQHWLNFREIIKGSVEAAKNKIDGFSSAEDIDLVILTGGHSQWYAVQKMILSESTDVSLNFAKIRQNSQRLIIEPNPQETVALGLVYRDLGLDVKRVMGNSLWLGYEINGAASPISNGAMTDDVLPISKTITHQYEVVTDLWDTNSIKVEYFFIYGGEKRKRKVTIYKTFPMPAKIKNIATAVMKTPLAVGKMLSKLPKGAKAAAEVFSAEYVNRLKIKIRAQIEISTYEHIAVKGSISLEGYKDVNFSVNI